MQFNIWFNIGFNIRFNIGFNIQFNIGLNIELKIGFNIKFKDWSVKTDRQTHTHTHRDLDIIHYTVYHLIRRLETQQLYWNFTDAHFLETSFNPLKFAGDTLWTSVIFPWNSIESPLNVSQKTLQSFLKTLWNFLEISLKLLRNICETSLKHPLIFFQIHLKPT